MDNLLSLFFPCSFSISTLPLSVSLTQKTQPRDYRGHWQLRREETLTSREHARFALYDYPVLLRPASFETTYHIEGSLSSNPKRWGQFPRKHDSVLSAHLHQHGANCASLPGETSVCHADSNCQVWQIKIRSSQSSLNFVRDTDFFFFFFFDSLSLFSSGCPGVRCIDQVGLKLTKTTLPLAPLSRTKGVPLHSQPRHRFSTVGV